MKTTREVISKSAKRKISSFVDVPMFNFWNEKWEVKRVHRAKADDFTEMVVYKTKLSSGKYLSKTRHERIK